MKDKKLEEEFNLNSIDDVLKQAIEDSGEKKHEIDLTSEAKNALQKAREIKQDLAMHDMDMHDNEMDKFAEDAYDHSKSIMELGMAVEARHSAEMFQAAATMLKLAIESKNAKVDKKLKLLDLDLKHRRLTIEEKRVGLDIYDAGEGSGIYNREDLLKDENDNEI